MLIVSGARSLTATCIAHPAVTLRQYQAGAKPFEVLRDRRFFEADPLIPRAIADSSR